MQKKLIIWFHTQREISLLKNLCQNIKGNTLCLFQLVEKHGVLLYNEIKNT